MEGYTDDEAEFDSNMELSADRAASVKAYLVENFGIEADRLCTMGLGSTQPVETNDTPEEGKMKWHQSLMTGRAKRLTFGASVLALTVPILVGARSTAPLANSDLAYVVVDNSTTTAGTTLMITDIGSPSRRSEVPPDKCFGIRGAVACFFDHPVWSPDGERLAFIFTALADSRGPFQVWVADRDGKNARSVTGTKGDSRHPTWSPDGQRIAFDEGGFIYRVELCKAGLPVEKLGPGTNPSWSPNNAWLAYELNGDIYRMDWRKGGSVTRLTTDEAVDKDPAWAKDMSQGLMIAWASNRAGTFDIYLMDQDGQNVRLVVKEPRDQHAPDLLERFPGVVYEENREVFFGARGGASRHIVKGFSPAMGLSPKKSIICPK